MIFLNYQANLSSNASKSKNLYKLIHIIGKTNIAEKNN